MSQEIVCQHRWEVLRMGQTIYPSEGEPTVIPAIRKCAICKTTVTGNEPIPRVVIGKIEEISELIEEPYRGQD